MTITIPTSILFWLAATAPSYAASVSPPSISAAVYKCTGDCTISGDCYTLTKESGFQVGAVWGEQRVDITSSFTLDADIFLGTKESGADGMAFVIQNQLGNEATGSSGGGLGYLGLAEYFAVEIDTYQNTNESSSDHISVSSKKNGEFARVDVENVEDGQYHQFSVTWDADDGTLKVSLDNQVRLTTTVDSISAQLIGNPSTAFFGFTAATGGANNIHEVCNLSQPLPPPCLPPPSPAPSVEPSAEPSSAPSGNPTSKPSSAPSSFSSGMPSSVPSSSLSGTPSVEPSAEPSSVPSGSPSSKPSSSPSGMPSSIPSGTPIVEPSAEPSSAPSGNPTSKPSSSPSGMPSSVPSSSPSGNPSVEPSAEPSSTPSAVPSTSPSSMPSFESVSHSLCENFAVHARTTVTFDGAMSTVRGGDVGVSPGISITGSFTFDAEGQTIGQVVLDSSVFAASVLTAHAEAMAVSTGIPMAIEIGGLTFTPGTYTSDSAINFAYGTVVTLDGLNEPNPTFLFQAGSTLVTAANTYFILKNGARAENIYWALGTAATLGANSVLEGSILAGTAITFGTKSELHGCALAQSAVTFESEGSIEPNHYIGDDNWIANPAVPGPKQSPIVLGSLCNYAILAETGISTVATSAVNGNIGVSAIAATAITGFGLILDSEGQFSTSSQVNGKAYAADYGGVTADDLTVAVLDMQTAYTDAASRTTADLERINPLGGFIGGQTLTPGVYIFTTAIKVYSDITLKGGPDDIFILQTTGFLSLTANVKVFLEGGVQAKNIFWQVAGNVAIGVGAHMEGILLVKTDVAFTTGSSLNGSIFAQTAVALGMAMIAQADTCPGVLITP